MGLDARTQRGPGPADESAIPYFHTPPQDSKAVSDADSAPTASSSFEAEFRAHADLVSALQRWQAGALPPALEWHELVPAAVRLGLDKDTVERQGLLWEIIRSEQEYVKALEGGLNVRPPLLFARRQALSAF